MSMAQNPIDFETISIGCHVGPPSRFVIHLDLLGALGTQALVESEVGGSQHFHQWEIVIFNGHRPSNPNVKAKWDSLGIFTNKKL
jgi:hypothetical protein